MRANRARVAALTALAALAAVAPAAAHGAAREVATTPGAFARPALADDRVVALRGGLRVAPTLVSYAADGSETVLATGRPGRASFTYAASDQRVVATELTSNIDAIESWRTLAGGPAGPLNELARCDRPGPYAPPPPAAHGGVVAFTGADCAVDRITLYDGRGTRTLDAGGRVTALAVAGRYVAWVVAGERPIDARAVVWDSATGALAFTVDRSSGAVPVGLDLRDDGVLVVVGHTAPGDGVPVCDGPFTAPRVAWHSSTDPSAHVVGVPRCGSARARIAGERIALLRTGPNGKGTQIVLAGLDGSVVREVASFTGVYEPGDRFDFDGRRVAWADSRCRDDAVLVRGADDGPAEPALACPIRVGNLRLGRDGRAHVRVACPNGCLSPAGNGIRFIAPRWLHVVGTRRGIPIYGRSVGLDIRPGASRTVRLPLTRRQRALVRSRGRVQVTLRVNGRTTSQRLVRVLRAR